MQNQSEKDKEIRRKLAKLQRELDSIATEIQKLIKQVSTKKDN